MICTPPRICLQRKHAEQILLNHRLMDDISELQQEAKLMRDIPKRLSESVSNCKDIYEDVLSIVQVKYMCHICTFQPLYVVTNWMTLWLLLLLLFCDLNRVLYLMRNHQLQNCYQAPVKLVKVSLRLWKLISQWQWMTTVLSLGTIL